MVAVPPGQQAVHSVAGAGANAASAFILPTVSARGVTDAQMTKWRIAFQNLCALQVLLRMEDTPKAICSIFSEPEEVYKRGGRFDFTDKGRLWVLSGGNTMRLHMTANHLAWAKFSPITDSAQVRELLCQNNTKLIMNVRRAIAASGSESNEDGATSYGQVITECKTEMEAISTSISMLPYIDPTFQSLTPSCPLVASDAKSAMVNSSISAPFLTYDADTSYDPSESHWLAQLRRDFEQEARWHQAGNVAIAATNIKKDLVVQVNKTVNVRKLSCVGKQFAENLQVEMSNLSLTGSICKLSAMAADGLMAQLRTCTSYQEPFDESTACNLDERLACITKVLNIRTSGNAKRYIDEALDALKSKYSDAQLRDMAKQRKARIKRLTRPSDAITFAHRTGMCIDPKCVDAHDDFTFVDVLTEGRCQKLLFGAVFRAQPGRVSAPPINFGSVVIGGFSPRYFPPGTHHGPRSCNYPGTSKADFCSPRVSASRGPLSLMGPTIEALTRDFSGG